MDEKLRSYTGKLLKEDKRADGRKATDFRELKIEKGITKTAEGSAKVTLGNTEVIAGVKVEVGTPYSDAPDQGTIMVNAELVPLSNPNFETGPPSITAIELARVVDRGIRESKTIDFKSLCITEGEAAWTIIIDLVPLNADGNLQDACALAAIAALQDMKFPEYKDGVIDYKKKTKNGIKLLKTPIEVTVFKIGDYLIVDPTEEEESVIDARLTVASTSDKELCAMQKGGDEALTEDEVFRMIDLSLSKAAELRKALG